MYRAAIEALKKWKAKSARKPLIIRGARQVGKTWLMKEFGKAAFAHTVYVNFEGNQYVLQQLKTLPDIGIYYWMNERSTSEIDFLLDMGNTVIPLEVKAEVNLQSKSLRAFAEKYHTALSVRSAMTDYRREAHLLNLPLYAIGNILEMISL